MKRLLFLFLIVTLLLFAPKLLAQSKGKPAQHHPAKLKLNYVPNEVLVKFKAGVSLSTKEKIKQNAGVKSFLAKIKLDKTGKKAVYRFQLRPNVSVKEAIKRFEKSSLVAYAELNYIRRASYTPNDPRFLMQWGLENIDAPEAWDREKGQTNSPVVAVIDTGIDKTHPDLASQLWVNQTEASGTPGVDDDRNGYVDDVNGYNWAGISQTWANSYWDMWQDTTNPVAQSILGTGQKLTHVGTYISKTGSPSSNINIAVRDSLTGANLATATVTPNEVNYTGKYIYKELSQPVTLAENQPYYLVFWPDGAGDSYNYYELYDNFSGYWGYIGDAYPDGYEYWFNGSNWVEYQTDDFFFFTNANANPRDDNSHGTHVSGIIAATQDNTEGVSGVAPGAKIMALKAGDASGLFYSSDVMAAVNYAATNGAKVINLSIAGGSSSQAEQDVFTNAYNQGVTVLAAAGNDGDNSINYPAGYNYVIGVGATDNQDQKAWFSNYNSSVDVSAPGVDILSTVPSYYYATPYEYFSGTSMATPMAAGVAALVISNRPYSTPAQVEHSLTWGADDLGAPGRDDYFGHGRLNAFKALQDQVPHLYLTSPQSNGALYGAKPIISDNTVTLSVVDLAANPGENQIARTTFSYSLDGGKTWQLIGEDTTVAPEPADKVKWWPGSPLSRWGQMKNGVGGYGWQVSWDTSPLPEGPVDVEIVALSLTGNSSTLTVPLYIDRTPPLPHFTQPNFEQTVSGVTTVTLTSDATDITKLDVYLQDKTQVPNITYDDTESSVTQTGLGHQDQHRVPEETSQTGDNHCGPTAAKNALERLLPTPDETANLQRARTLARKMQTSEESGTANDDFDKGLRDYLKEIGKDSSFTVTRHGTVIDESGTVVDRPRWDDFENALRSGESVVVLLSKYTGPGDDGQRGTADDVYNRGHYVTMEDKRSRPVTTNKYKVSYVDPWDGQSHDSTWTTSDNTATADTVNIDGEEWDVHDLWEISPRANSAPPSYQLIGSDSNGADGWSVSWNTNNLKSGYYILYAEFTDANGNKGAKKQVVYVSNVSPNTLLVTNPDTPNGQNGWYKTIPSITLIPDEPATTWYRWDAGSWQLYQGAIYPSQGIHTLYYYSKDSAGNTETVKSKTFKVDTTAPTVSLSTPYYSTNISTKPTFKLSWTAADNASGVKAYDVIYKIGTTGSWTNLLTNTTKTYSYFTGYPGKTYYFKVRAKDIASNISNYTAEKTTIVPYNQGVLYRYGTWYTALNSKMYKGDSFYTGKKGSYLKRKLYNLKELSLIVTKRPKGGKAYIYLNGVKVKTIDLYSSTVKYRVPILIKSYSSPQTVVLKVYVPHAKNSLSGGYRVEVDGVAVKR